jgi:glycine/D-amino acid oxidase-like deaminating enzyme/nitrite reductase/ring-hydroxylating ferredoxin subunit
MTDSDRSLPGDNVSLWITSAPAPERPRASRDGHADVVVIGGGMVGVTTALLLRRQGARVVLLEAGRVCGGVTGHTTAKLSSLHGLSYATIAQKHGDDAARVYGEANEAGIARIAELVEELEIDCELTRKPNFTYTEDASQRSQIEQEAEVAARVGLPASLVEETDLPYPISAAVRFEDQADFHPRRYLLGLAEALVAEGGEVFERSPVVSVDQGTPCRVQVRGGATLTADRVVVATHMPLLDRGLWFARVHPERSYVVAARASAALPAAMYLSAESPAKSIRAARVDGEDWLLVGGEGHKTGHSRPAESYRRLADFTRARFAVDRIDVRWASQDNQPVDGMPYVGALWPFSDRLLTATGFKKWGLAAGTAAAMILADRIAGRDNPWATTFDAQRVSPRAGGPTFVKENAEVGLRFFGDRLKRRSVRSLDRGAGGIVRDGVRQAAVYKDEQGSLHALSARCTHLGCIVNWNGGDKTWDCPCHGSRFALDGTVIEGPAVAPLKPVKPPTP